MDGVDFSDIEHLSAAAAAVARERSAGWPAAGFICSALFDAACSISLLWTGRYDDASLAEPTTHLSVASVSVYSCYEKEGGTRPEFPEEDICSGWSQSKTVPYREFHTNALRKY